jgi:hypothetical protein
MYPAALFLIKSLLMFFIFIFNLLKGTNLYLTIQSIMKKALRKLDNVIITKPADNTCYLLADDLQYF